MEHEPIFADEIEVLRTAMLPRLELKLGRGVPISTKIPNPRPSEFVRLVSAGGERKNIITASPTVAVEAWAADAPTASRICRVATAIVHSLAGELVGGVQLGGVGTFSLPQDLPDEDSGHARYTSTLSIDMSYIDTL